MSRKQRENAKLNLRIDRFFSNSRKILKNSFQNMQEFLLDVFKEYDVPYVLTTEPKRKYVKDGTLIKKGFRIYYQFLVEKDYEEFVGLLFETFSEEFYLKQKKYNLKNKKIVESGYYQITAKSGGNNE